MRSPSRFFRPSRTTGHHPGRLGADAARQGDGHLARRAHHGHWAGGGALSGSDHQVDLPSTDQAELTVRTELTNAVDEPVEGVLKGKVEKSSLHSR